MQTVSSSFFSLHLCLFLCLAQVELLHSGLVSTTCTLCMLCKFCKPANPYTVFGSLIQSTPFTSFRPSHVILRNILSLAAHHIILCIVSAQFAFCCLQNTHNSAGTSHEAGGHSADHCFQPALACYPHSPHSHAPAWLQTRAIHGSCHTPLPSHTESLLNCLSFAVCQHKAWWALCIPGKHATRWGWPRCGNPCKGRHSLQPYMHFHLLIH